MVVDITPTPSGVDLLASAREYIVRTILRLPLGQVESASTGDLVTRVGDRTVRSWEDLVLAIRQLEAGSTAKVRVRRGSAEQTLQVTVGSRPVDSR